MIVPNPKNQQQSSHSHSQDAGGLLADVGLANEAARWSAELCPDLAMAASARGPDTESQQKCVSYYYILYKIVIMIIIIVIIIIV